MYKEQVSGYVIINMINQQQIKEAMMKYVWKNTLLCTVWSMILFLSGTSSGYAEIRRSQSLLGPGIYSLYLGDPTQLRTFSLEETFDQMANNACRGNYKALEQALTSNQMVGIIECPSQTSQKFQVPKYGISVNSADVLRNDVLVESRTYSLYVGMPDMLTRISNLHNIFRQTADEVCQGEYNILEQESTANQMIGIIRCQAINKTRSYQPKAHTSQPQAYEQSPSRAVENNIGLSISGKLWYVDWQFGDLPFGDDNDYYDAALMWGPQISFDIGNNFWISGMFLSGSFAHKDESFTQDFDQKDAEILVGKTFGIFDIGLGTRYVHFQTRANIGGDELDKEESDSWGAMTYFGSGNTFGTSPIGWYAGASWMFTDFDESLDLEHYNFEGGLFLSMNKLTGTLGYRFKRYYDVSFVDSETMKGFVASVGFYF